MIKFNGRYSFVRALINFCRRIFGFPESSAACARDRLRVLILCDRIALGRIDLEGLKSDMALVALKYLDVDPSQVKLEVRRRGSGAVLLAVFPLRAAGGATR